MIRVIDRAFDILEFLAESPHLSQPISAIAKKVDLPVATCSRILAALVERGVVEQKGAKRGFSVGPSLFQMTAKGPYRKDLVQVAEPRMIHLAQDVRETVTLAVLSQGRRYVLCEIAGDRLVQVQRESTRPENIFGCATGRLLLAALEPSGLEVVLAKNGLPGDEWREASTEKSLSLALAAIRQDGFQCRFAQDEITRTAVAIRQGGEIVASLGIALPSSRYAGVHAEEVEAGLRRTAEAIGAML